MKNTTQRLALAASTAGLMLQLTAVPGAAQSDDAALVAKAKQIHSRFLKLDTHNDIEPSNFTADCNYKMRLTTQVNIPKMVEGHLLSDVIAINASIDIVMGEIDR